MNFPKVYIRSAKIFSLLMGIFLLYFNIVLLYSWIFGPSKYSESLFNGKDTSMGWGVIIIWWLNYSFINDFFYYRKKMIVGFNDNGLCIYNEKTSSYIFILWTELEDVGVSFGFEGRFCNPQGLIKINFRRATVCKVDKKSSYLHKDGTCDLAILDEEEVFEGGCSADFGYWSWQPYIIKKEINKRKI